MDSFVVAFLIQRSSVDVNTEEQQDRSNTYVNNEYDLSFKYDDSYVVEEQFSDSRKLVTVTEKYSNGTADYLIDLKEIRDGSIFIDNKDGFGGYIFDTETNEWETSGGIKICDYVYIGDGSSIMAFQPSQNHNQVTIIADNGFAIDINNYRNVEYAKFLDFLSSIMLLNGTNATKFSCSI